MNEAAAVSVGALGLVTRVRFQNREPFRLKTRTWVEETESVLKRFEGLQIHRSHWVAWGAVVETRREGDRVLLRLSTGDDIPVSRSHISKLREAGVLPKRGV